MINCPVCKNPFTIINENHFYKTEGRVCSPCGITYKPLLNVLTRIIFDKAGNLYNLHFNPYHLNLYIQKNDSAVRVLRFNRFVPYDIDIERIERILLLG